MANFEAEMYKRKVLFVCASKQLANMIREHVSKNVEVKDIQSLFSTIVTNLDVYTPPLYCGLSSSLGDNLPKYDAIFVDEAQDFTEEWAKIIRR